MNKTKYIILTLLMVLATSASAKKVQVPHVYMFGFSASFQDSTVYFTDIQDVQVLGIEFPGSRRNVPLVVADAAVTHDEGVDTQVQRSVAGRVIGGQGVQDELEISRRFGIFPRQMGFGTEYLC